MNRRRSCRVKETELDEKLSPFIEGRVFHVTRRGNLDSILAREGLVPDRERAYPSTFGQTYNSYFRNRDCVPLFDLVHPSAADIESRLRDCWPFQPARPGADIAILIVSPQAYSDLVPWTAWRDDGEPDEMVVPYVEAGYPDFLPLALIDEIIEVEVEEVPDSWQAMHRRLQGRDR